MEKQRQIKILSLIALVLAITGMTLGFAAFSVTLNISSSASVSPNSDDFKVRIVGLNGDNYMILEENYTTVSGNKSAIIGEDGLTVTGMTAKMTKPGDKVRWVGIIENVGEYDAYIIERKIEHFADTGTWKKCIPTGENALSNEYVEIVCEGIDFRYGIYEYDEESNTYVTSTPLSVGDLIEKNKKYFFSLTIKYLDDSMYPDGDFEVAIGDASLKFSTVY